MANGQKSPSAVFDLVARLGPVAGGVCGGFYTLAYVLRLFKQWDLETAAQASFGVAVTVAAVGLGKAAKAAKGIWEQREAEKSVGSPVLPSTSAIPGIQRKIDGMEKPT